MISNCIHCQSKNIVKNGLRRRNIRTKQSFLCRDCDKQFIDSDGFERMRHSPEIITRAVHQHVDGFSLFKTQYHLWQHDGVRVTRRTISQWTKKYSDFLKSDTRSSKTNT